MNRLLDSPPGTTIEFGSDAAAFWGRVLRKQGKVVLFTGPGGAAKSGALTDLRTAATDAGCRVIHYGSIGPEPESATVEAMAQLLADEAPDQVAAIGGGSVLDAAKAALLMHQSGMRLAELYGINRCSGAHPGRKFARIIAVPTTSGTGSEATQYANIVERRLGVKKLIAENESVPENALVNPRYAATMPEHVTRATGCDALAHLIEGYLNVGADGNDPAANARAERGIRLIVDHLPAVLRDPQNAVAREALAEASALGGMVIRFKSTGLPHLCSFSWFGRIEHGLAVVLLLGSSWRYYLGNARVAARTMQLASCFPGETPLEVVRSFRRFLDRVGVPDSLSACPGITEELLRATARSGKENPMKLQLAPRPVAPEQSETILNGILQEAWKGGFL